MVDLADGKTPVLIGGAAMTQEQTIAIHGTLEPFFETGTEGVCWAFGQDGWPGYDGLHVLIDGDDLTVYADTGAVLWKGVVALARARRRTPAPDNPAYIQQEIFGFWVHGFQKDLEPETWARFFFERRRAALRRPYRGPKPLTLTPDQKRVGLRAARRIFELLDVNEAEASRILALPDGFDPAEPSDIPEVTAKRIGHLFAISKELFGLCRGDWEAMRSWMRSPNQALGGHPPIVLMVSGQDEDFVQVLRYLGSRRREWA